MFKQPSGLSQTETISLRMKLSKIEIDGFRCFRARRELKLDGGRSLCLLAENGRGKSSVVDALEFWSSGDVARTRREGVGLSSLIHLDRSDATVEVRVDGVGVASRHLRGNKAASLVAGAGPLSVQFESDRLPILRYQTMANFVDKSANDKRAELLEALGLTELAELRAGIRSVDRQLRKQAREASGRAEQAKEIWKAHGTVDGPANTRLAELSKTAGIAPRLEDPDALLGWTPERGSRPASRALSPRIQELGDAYAAFQSTSPSLWNAHIRDRSAAERRGLSSLLKVGGQVLESSDEDRCPLCLVGQSRDALLDQVEGRAKELVEVDSKFDEAEAALDEHGSAIGRVARALSSLLELDSPALSKEAPAVESAAEEWTRYLESARAARRARTEIAEPPSISDALLGSLEEVAMTAPAEAGPALLELADLKGKFSSMRKAEEASLAAASRAKAAAAAAEVAEKFVERTINDALASINEPLAEFYGALVGRPVYSDLQLVYTQQRAGGIDFEFTWDGRHAVRPPQKIMSESELNALGLALFLARLKVDPPKWRTMVLDDVIASFDAVHRTRLVRLLSTEFSDWQVILLTHDPQLHRTINSETSGWTSVKVTAWDVSDGPTFGSANLRRRLEERLDAGEPAEELGGLARQAMEEALERPVRKMRLRIRHDPTNTYSADEYRRALVDGLRDGGFPRADAPILQQLATDGSTSNRACHFRDNEPGVTEQDLRLLLSDLAELEVLFNCESCGKKAWSVLQQGSTRCQCECGSLSCA